MANERKPQQVAERTLILGAIAFRASLEVTDHPRVVELSQQLLPWLSHMGCADELDPIERELLATPLGDLSDSQQIDANWAGEAAALFCWMLNLGAPLEEMTPADQADLLDVLPILRPEAAEILQLASLRDRREIEDTCRHFVLIRSLLLESRIEPPSSDIIRRANVQSLNDLRVVVTDDAVTRASEVVASMTPQQRSQVAGLYMVRDHAARWFLSDRGSYFD
jgi:hypothetical protein